MSGTPTLGNRGRYIKAASHRDDAFSDSLHLSLSRTQARLPMAATSNAQLAQLLSESYQQIDRLTESLAAEKHRTEHYQRIAGSSLQNGHGDLLERVRVAEERAYIAERHRDEEIAQRETITRLWHQLRDYLALLDAHSSNARKEMDHMIDMKTPPQNLRTVPVDVFPQRRKRRSSEEHAGHHKRARPNVRRAIVFD